MAIEHELEGVRDWAKSKIDAGQEPPWAWYQYMKLVEVTEEIMASLAALETKPGVFIQVVNSNYQSADAPACQDDHKPQMPM